MSEQEEFEKWIASLDEPPTIDHEELQRMEMAFKAGRKRNAAEIAALLGSGLDCYKPTYRQAFKHSELYSNPTKLLTGDCECPFTMGDDYIEVAHEPIGICVSCGEQAFTRNPEKVVDVLCWACAYDSAN